MSFMDIFVAGMVLLVVAVAAIVTLVVLAQIELNPQYQAEMPAEGRAAVDQTQVILGTFDYLGVFVLFGIMGASILSSVFIRSHPVFFVIGFIIMLIFAATSGMFFVMYSEFASDPLVAATATNFTWTLLVFQYFPLIGLVGMIAIAVVTYGKVGT